jgi:hypothetical protein
MCSCSCPRRVIGVLSCCISFLHSFSCEQYLNFLQDFDTFLLAQSSANNSNASRRIFEDARVSKYLSAHATSFLSPKIYLPPAHSVSSLHTWPKFCLCSYASAAMGLLLYTPFQGAKLCHLRVDATWLASALVHCWAGSAVISTAGVAC